MIGGIRKGEDGHKGPAEMEVKDAEIARLKKAFSKLLSVCKDAHMSLVPSPENAMEYIAWLKEDRDNWKSTAFEHEAKLADECEKCEYGEVRARADRLIARVKELESSRLDHDLENAELLSEAKGVYAEKDAKMAVMVEALERVKVWASSVPEIHAQQYRDEVDAALSSAPEQAKKMLAVVAAAELWRDAKTTGEHTRALRALYVATKALKAKE